MIITCIENFLQQFTQSNIFIQCFILIGAYKVSLFIFTVISFFVSLVLPDLDLLNRFGQHSWALVTGASDGLGKALCFSLSKRGFNVVLVGRNQEKTQRVVDELKKKYPNVHYRIVLADFTQIIKDNQFINKIVDQVKDLDISILVNDVGVDLSQNYNFYHQIPLQYVIDNINVNCSSQALLSRAIIPLMLKRQNRSCIIDISSFVSIMGAPILELYSATKAFNNHLSRSLNQEYKSKIDFLTVNPLQVVSNMTQPYIKAGVEFQIKTAEQFSESTMNQVCRTSTTLGHYSHRILGSLLQCIPECIGDPLSYKEMAKIKVAVQKLK